jgi:hypothetical protein
MVPSSPPAIVAFAAARAAVALATALRAPPRTTTLSSTTISGLAATALFVALVLFTLLLELVASVRYNC